MSLLAYPPLKLALENFSRELTHIASRFPRSDKKNRHPLFAQTLQKLLNVPGLFRDEDLSVSSTVPEGYQSTVLWSNSLLDLSLIALVWKLGNKTPIHDHHAACMMGIYQGLEKETRFELLEDVKTNNHLHDYSIRAPQKMVTPVDSKTLVAGEICVIQPGDKWEIHQVEAISEDPETTISLHLYEIDVTRIKSNSSIRNEYVLAPKS